VRGSPNRNGSVIIHGNPAQNFPQLRQFIGIFTPAGVVFDIHGLPFNVRAMNRPFCNVHVFETIHDHLGHAIHIPMVANVFQFINVDIQITQKVGNAHCIFTRIVKEKIQVELLGVVVVGRIIMIYDCMCVCAVFHGVYQLAL
jgi:hypothetical protein